jgi:hypothetical protein
VTFASLRMPSLALRSADRRTVWGRMVRTGWLVLGGVLTVVGAIGALLPGHLGLLLLVPGLIIVLRASFPARRRFIGLQRRHPKIVFPIRRLLRREPEVFPVAWQQVLRMERMVVPHRWRFARRLRLRYFRR